MLERTENLDSIVPLPDFDFQWEKQVPYSFGKLAILIEFLAGDTRTKVLEGGTVVEGVMPAAYGFILRTTDAHGEEIDMYLAPMADRSASIYVIDQVDPQSKAFDEHKVMLGFASQNEVTHIYTSVFENASGPDRLGAITKFSEDEFLAWVVADGASFKPASEYKPATLSSTDVAGVELPSKGSQPLRDEAGGVFVDLTDLSKGPKIKTYCSDNGEVHHHWYFFSALGFEVWSNLIDTVCRILDLADEKVTLHIHIASPGGAVFLMGRVVSAIARTKAKVITYAEGMVASAATSIWISGHERYILPAAVFMQHMSSQILSGKTTDIAAKANFCFGYIEKMLAEYVKIGLFTPEEVSAMIEQSADIYISGNDAIARVGAISTRS